MYGRYSPTIFGKTFVPVELNGIWDAEDYDQYGYNADGYDRAGKREWDNWQEHLREEGLSDWKNEGGQD